MKVLLTSAIVAIVHVSAVLGIDTATAAEYIWPSSSDFLESQLYEQVGTDITSIAQFVVPCGITPLGTGRNINAEWVRAVYHDVATADVVAGTGGVDASIGFEMDRPENAGPVAFNETLQFLRGSLTAQSSMADLLVIGLITSVGSCSNGKVVVPFRSGRIDAAAAGPSGVPKPDETIESHTAAFKRMGLTQDEMIGLVACGHSMGGVHGKDFPEIVDKPASGPVSTLLFASVFSELTGYRMTTIGRKISTSPAAEPTHLTMQCKLIYPIYGILTVYIKANNRLQGQGIRCQRHSEPSGLWQKRHNQLG